MLVMVNGTTYLCAMDQQAVLKRNDVIRQVAIASREIKSNPIKAFNLLSQAYKHAEVRLGKKVECKKDGKLLWKVVLSDGTSDYDDDGVLWMALLNQVESLRVNSKDQLAEDVSQLSTLVGRSLTINAAQRQFFSENNAAMLEGWYLFHQFKTPTPTELIALGSEKEAELLKEIAADEEALTQWKASLLSDLPEDGAQQNNLGQEILQAE